MIFSGQSVRTVVLVVATVVAAIADRPVAIAQLTDEGIAALDLGFEGHLESAGWYLGGKGYRVASVESRAHSGARCLRLDFLETGTFGVATNQMDAKALRGRRLRLSGWLATESITSGTCGLWMRIDGPDGSLAFDNMRSRGLGGTRDWEQHVIELDVADAAEAVFFGVILSGNGSAWADDLAFEVLDSPPPPPEITIRGVVRGPDGTPVPGALVALIADGDHAAQECLASGPDGSFTFAARAGRWALTATTPGFTAAFRGAAEVDAATGELALGLLPRDAGVTIRGAVRDELGAPCPDLRLRVVRQSAEVGDIFHAVTDAEGRYGITMPAGEAFFVGPDDNSWQRLQRQVPGTQDGELDLLVVRPGPAPDAVIEDLRARAIPLRTTDPGNGFDDLEPLRAVIGDARVVALGEATHGTREFLRFKHRMFEFLVERMGFTVFALEANWPECEAIDAYVREGKGDARSALAGIYFWTWNTEEVLELIEWMRAYNADPAHARKLRFVGVDMQTSMVAAREALAYLEACAPETAAAFEAGIEPLSRRKAESDWSGLAEDVTRRARETVEAAIRDLEARQTEFVARSGEGAWRTARQHLAILQQAERQYSAGSGRSNVRDEAMAANLRWVLGTEPPGTGVLLWAHNAHVARSASGDWKPMGAHLAEQLGTGYVALGFVFSGGSFQARDWTEGPRKPGGLRVHEVGPSPAGDVGAEFARTGLGRFVLDLRIAEEDSPARRWLGVPRPQREIGAAFPGEKHMSLPKSLPGLYDAVIFVETTTTARKLESFPVAD